eukprot:6761029-Pyramimonas_sp.AAC.1
MRAHAIELEGDSKNKGPTKLIYNSDTELQVPIAPPPAPFYSVYCLQDNRATCTATAVNIS